jgi:hypothetical protein
MTQAPVEQAPGSRLEARRLARARARQRRRRIAVVALLFVAVVLVGAAFARAAGGSDEAAAPPAGPSADPTAEPAATPSAPAPTWPEEGSGEWRYAPGQDTVLGGEGDLLRFRVAVEADLDLAPEEFAAAVDEILADPRGWTATERRFQRVGEDDESEFTIYLATPGTSEEICAEAGLHTEGYTSCHVPGEVVINVARWLTAVPGYPLPEYRAFALNHEVGHELGAAHRGCPGSGKPAPVMMPQTQGLDGCTPHGWPLLDGERYHGPKVP